jgi:hypothetical protein
MTAPITLGNENAAFRATALSIVWPIYILLKSLQCLDRCIVWTSVKFGLTIDTTKSFWQEVECITVLSRPAFWSLAYTSISWCLWFSIGFWKRPCYFNGDAWTAWLQSGWKHWSGYFVVKPGACFWGSATYTLRRHLKHALSCQWHLFERQRTGHLSKQIVHSWVGYVSSELEAFFELEPFASRLKSSRSPYFLMGRFLAHVCSPSCWNPLSLVSYWRLCCALNSHLSCSNAALDMIMVGDKDACCRAPAAMLFEAGRRVLRLALPPSRTHQHTRT